MFFPSWKAGQLNLAAGHNQGVLEGARLSDPVYTQIRYFIPPSPMCYDLFKMNQNMRIRFPTKSNPSESNILF